MRLLLDESVPRRLRTALPKHSVSTVVELGWSGTRNGELLRLASEKFDVFITVDQNLPFQQNASTLPVSVVVLVAPSNKLEALLPLVPKLEAILKNLEPGGLARIEL